MKKKKTIEARIEREKGIRDLFLKKSQLAHGALSEKHYSRYLERCEIIRTLKWTITKDK